MEADFIETIILLRCRSSQLSESEPNIVQCVREQQRGAGVRHGGQPRRGHGVQVERQHERADQEDGQHDQQQDPVHAQPRHPLWVTVLSC